MMSVETGPPITAPTGPAHNSIAIARAMRACGYQRVRQNSMPGLKPASNTPSRKRKT